jgi:hypothetical protein
MTDREPFDLIAEIRGIFRAHYELVRLANLRPAPGPWVDKLA